MTRSAPRCSKKTPSSVRWSSSFRARVSKASIILASCLTLRLPVAGRELGEVGGLGRRVNGDRGERAVRHHHRVPVAGGAAGGEQLAGLGVGQVFPRRHEDPGGRKKAFAL